MTHEARERDTSSTSRTTAIPQRSSRWTCTPARSQRCTTNVQSFSSYKHTMSVVYSAFRSSQQNRSVIDRLTFSTKVQCCLLVLLVFRRCIRGHRMSHLYGLFAASDPPNRPLILTAEQTSAAAGLDSGERSPPQCIRTAAVVRAVGDSRGTVRQSRVVVRVRSQRQRVLCDWGLTLCARDMPPNAGHCSSCGAVRRLEGTPASRCCVHHLRVSVCGRTAPCGIVSTTNCASVSNERGGALSELQWTHSANRRLDSEETRGTFESRGLHLPLFVDRTGSPKKCGIELFTVDSSGLLSESLRGLMHCAEHIWSRGATCGLRTPPTTTNPQRIIVAEYDGGGNTIALRLYLLKHN